uniref:Scarlet n=1 Tax=Nilaparvata lugens TaxID=108931 RepID=A0A1B0YYV1_NILLU|nr:protein scarlet [Nilaparvata lugens]AWC08635.1 scarlet [Nilaparvata lugens]
MITDKENMAGVKRREGVTLAWRHLSVYARVKNKKLLAKSTTTYKKIIDDVTGIIEPGNLVAIIGASGAGKSTLMGCLAQRMSGDMVMEGSVLINGRQASGMNTRGISGFMHQEDMFRGALTVSEHLHFLARLRLDRRTSIAQRARLVDDLLRQLGLEHCRHTRIGAPGPGQRVVLSGGERKRLSFAGECLSYPPLLFCDEPTTGLDSSSALALVRALRAMAIERRRTVLISIHQPGSHLVELFHSVLLLSQGRIAFMGSTDEALAFYKLNGFECPSSYNPADFFIKQLAGSKTSLKEETDAEKLCSSYSQSDSFKRVQDKIESEIKKSSLSTSQEFKIELKLERRKGPRWLTKLFWLWYREMLEVARNPHVQTIRLFHKIVLAIVVGLCFTGTLTLDQKGVQAIQGVLFMLVTENTFSPMYAALDYFPHQLPLFAREHANGVCTRLQFYISAIASMTPVLTLEPVIFIAVLYFISGLSMSLNAYILSNIAVILCINVSAACGIFFSTVFTSIPVAMAYLVPFDYCLMITSGLFVKLSTLPWHVSWIRYLSWMMYTNEALSIVSWQQVSNITCETHRADLPCLNSGEEVLEKYSFSASNLNCDFINLFILYLTFHILAFIFFFFRSNRVS